MREPWVSIACICGNVYGKTDVPVVAGALAKAEGPIALRKQAVFQGGRGADLDHDWARAHSRAFLPTSLSRFGLFGAKHALPVAIYIVTVPGRWSESFMQPSARHWRGWS